MDYCSESTAYLQHCVVANYDDQGSHLGELEFFPIQLVGVTASGIPLERTASGKSKLSQHIRFDQVESRNLDLVDLTSKKIEEGDKQR